MVPVQFNSLSEAIILLTSKGSIFFEEQSGGNQQVSLLTLHFVEAFDYIFLWLSTQFKFYYYKEIFSSYLIYLSQMAVIIDGRKLAREKEKALAGKLHRPLKLVSLLIGNNSASKVYLRVKKQAAERVGIEFVEIDLPIDTSKEKIISQIKQLNNDPQVQGIMVQLPCEHKILSVINPLKDVDCLGAENLALLAAGKPRFLPAVVKAIMEIIKFAGYSIVGKKIAVVGQGKLVGQPLSAHLKTLGAKVLLANEYTDDLPALTRQADVLVVATGVPGLIKKEMVRPKALVIDTGSPKAEVDFEEVEKVASFITPVPGGVGPLTVACLLENLLTAAELQIANKAGEK